MRTTAVLLGMLISLPLAAAAVPSTPAELPVQNLESPLGTGSQRVCAADGGLCARADLVGIFQGCEQTGSTHACTVRYVLYLEASGLRPGCFEVTTTIMKRMLGCTYAPLEFYEAFDTSEKTYEGVAADGTVSESGTLCVGIDRDEGPRCESFSVTVRFPEQRSVLANATLSYNTRASHAAATICRDPTTTSAGCIDLQVSGRVTHCTGTGADRTCTLALDVLHAGVGNGICSALRFAGIFDRTTCTDSVYAHHQQGGIVKEVGEATSIHEKGTFCLEGAASRCVSFEITVPLN